MARLLLLENDASARQSYRSALEDVGFVVADRAPQAFNGGASTSCGPDLVILGSELPRSRKQDRRNEITDNYPHVPVIVLREGDVTLSADGLGSPNQYATNAPLPADTLAEMAKAMLVPVPPDA